MRFNQVGVTYKLLDIGPCIQVKYKYAICGPKVCAPMIKYLHVWCYMCINLSTFSNKHIVGLSTAY